MSLDSIWDLQQRIPCFAVTSYLHVLTNGFEKCLSDFLLFYIYNRLDETITTLEHSVWSNLSLCSQAVVTHARFHNMVSTSLWGESFDFVSTEPTFK